MIKANVKKIEKALETPFQYSKELADDSDLDFDLHVKLYTKVPVIVHRDGVTVVEIRKFSLRPPSTRFPTFNARLSNWDDGAKRLVKIHELPTWRKPMMSQRCVVPLTGFVEPIYLGPHAGSAVEFNDKEKPILFAAGLYDGAIDPKTSEKYDGFAIILHTPNQFVLKTGHFRMPVFLTAENARRWITSETSNPEAAYQFLLKHRYIPHLEVHESRKLAKNWERRIEAYKSKLQREEAYMKALNSN